MTTSHEPEQVDDLSALAWVHDELRRSLETAHKALRRYLRESDAVAGSDVDAVDPAVLRTARVQLHQGAGALELVGLPLVAKVLRSGESAVQRFIAKPKLVNVEAVERVERVSFAVLDYLSRVLARKPVAALELFPPYAAAQTLAGADRVHPADLWPQELHWHALPADPTAKALASDDEAREWMESLALSVMRQPDVEQQKLMSDFCAGLGAGAQGDLATLWKLASAVFEAQATGLLATDVHSKRLASRLLSQLRQSVHGDVAVSTRLAQDLQFFCARAKAPEPIERAPRLAAVQSVWPRDPQADTDYEVTRLGRHDPAVITQARRRVSAAKDIWSGLAGGELHRRGALVETFALVAESIERLFPDGESLSGQIKAAAAQVASSAAAPPPPLAMEVATGLLCVEAALEEAELDHADLGGRVRRLADRIGNVAAGADAEALEDWMEELYRRVSDRQTMGSVVQELRASLSDVEKQIDHYFRDPSRREVLIPVPGQLSAMRGVLSVLDLDQASQAVLHMRDAIDELAQTEVNPEQAVAAGTFDRLADNLGALSFLIDMISVQPLLAKSLFRFDPQTGSLSAVMGQRERVSGFANLGPAAPDSASAPADTFKSVVAPAPAPAAVDMAVSAPSSGLEDDHEMREVFLEEAHEVLTEARESVAQLSELPNDLNQMTALRRAFHTLKGSSRMVGLGEFGEAAWSCEQLYNARLAQPGGMDADLAGFTGEALTYLSTWVNAIGAGREDGHRASALARAADGLRIDGRREPIGGPTIEAPSALQDRVPDLPKAEDLDLPAAAAAAPAPAVEPELPTAEVAELPGSDAPSEQDFELHFDEPEPDHDTLVMMPPLPDLELASSADPMGTTPADLTDHETIDLRFDADPQLDSTSATPEPEVIELSLDDFDTLTGDLSAPDVPEVIELSDAPVAAEPVAETAPGALVESEDFKLVGPLRIAIPLFNIFLNESDEQSRRLGVELAEWTLEQDQPIEESTIALAHSLAGNSGTVGFVDLSVLARALEHALMRSRAVGHGNPGEADLFTDAGDEVRRLLHQFAAGFLQAVAPELLQRLADHERQLAELPVESDDVLLDSVPGELEPAAPMATAVDVDDELDAADVIDVDLFPIFEEEADELIPQLRARLGEWLRHPSHSGAPAACLRTLHTFKGGARLAGAMRVGEMAHLLESAIEQLSSRGDVAAPDVEQLLARADAMASAFERLRRRGAAMPVPAPVVTAPPAEPILEAALPEPMPAPESAKTDLPIQVAAPIELAPIDWSRFAATPTLVVPVPLAGDAPGAGASGATVRVRASLLDRLVNEAGEVSITRARIEGDTRAMQGSLNDLTDNLERLRRQLRDLELQAETQISSRLEAAKAAAQSFDPLEMDRFTRFQELTRMMAESVNDVATVQRGLQRSLQSTEDELAAQARLTRDLQDDLLRTRMVEFESLADRLYRVVRQAAKDTGKAVRLDIVGGSIEVDRGVLERMIGPFEHLLRNSVAHGIEAANVRKKAGKDETGAITVTVTHERNEVGVEFGDDGAGLDLVRIRARAVERGLLPAEAKLDERELVQLIFKPGFSTADSVSELAGRGVGLDVVRAEVIAMGGRIETHSDAGRGTRLRLILPLTTAVTQVVMLRFGTHRVAVPSTLVEVVRRMPAVEVQASYEAGLLRHADEDVPFFWLGALLQQEAPGPVGERAQLVVVVRSASQRVALHIDEVLGNQEVVVKNLGPQLSRLPGIAGITLLPSGAAALIYNPVALVAVYGDEARARMRDAPTESAHAMEAEPAAPLAPLVLVVDDSLTVRRVTQRLLLREGYRVTLAKDGLEAIERLADERPTVLLSDIEMPRMDGFDLVRNVRADARLVDLPVIMITSRIAQKHRDHAAELGVDHYLGKPFSEDELLALVKRYTSAAALQ